MIIEGGGVVKKMIFGGFIHPCIFSKKSFLQFTEISLSHFEDTRTYILSERMQDPSFDCLFNVKSRSPPLCIIAKEKGVNIDWLFRGDSAEAVPPKAHDFDS